MNAQEHPRLVLRGPGALELEHLDLSRNPIGDKGLALLAEPLKQNRTLRRLYLNYCEVTQVGLPSCPVENPTEAWTYDKTVVLFVLSFSLSYELVAYLSKMLQHGSAEPRIEM
jgi:hypothetical protein